METMENDVADTSMLEIDPRFLTWEKLERSRLKNLNIPNRYSRNFNISKSPRQSSVQLSLEEPIFRSVTSLSSTGKSVSLSSNSVAPFYTAEKPTCGFFFSRSTENKKKKFGIPPSDLVQWRSMSTFHTTSQ